MSLLPVDRRVLGRGPLLLLFSLLLVACGGKGAQVDAAGTHAVAASDYDRACADVADCVAVYEGALGCCSHGCPNAAIREDALPTYERDLDQRTPVCDPAPPCVPPPSCTEGRVQCVSGKCQLLLPDAGT